MIKLFTDEGWPNFSEDDGILSTGAPIIFIWGGRGTGKHMVPSSTCTRRKKSFYTYAARRSRRS